MCFDAPAAGCNTLTPDACDERDDCVIGVGPGSAPDGALGGQLMCFDAPPTCDNCNLTLLTVEECEELGTVVSDIGDGAVHDPDFLCPSGDPPVGTVPFGIEGAVCCGN